MPKFAARSRRSVATVMSTTVIGASLAVLLLPVAAPTAGAAAAPGSTQRASLESPGNVRSETGGQDSMLSGNGESVAFTSQSKLDPSLGTGSGTSAPNYRNVFVRDLVKNRTVMISRGRFTRDTGGSGTVGVNYGPKKLLELQPGGGGGTSDGVPIRDTEPNGNSYSPSISADGRFVAFTTYMTNLFLDDSDTDAEIVVVDRDPDNDGVYDEDGPGSNGNLRSYTYYRLTGGNGSFEYARLPKLAANASRIVWEQGEGRAELRSKSLNLRANPPVIGAEETVPVPDFLNRRVGEHGDPAISGDGNHIVAHVEYVPDCDGSCPISGFHSIVRTDMRTKTSIEVATDNGKPISTNRHEVLQHPAVNNDGSVIAFAAELFEDAIEGDPFSAFLEPTTYVVRVAGNTVTRTDIVSRDNNFTIINGDRPGLSNDGRYIAFVTNNLKAHDGTDGPTTNGDCIEPPQDIVRNSGEPMLRLNALPPRRNAPHTTCQVIVRDLIVDLDRRINEQSRLPGTLVSPNQAGNPGNGNTVPNIERSTFERSTAPSLSENGGRIAYDSNATDLVSQPADNNQRPDVFVRTLEPGLSGQTVEFNEVEINTSSTKTAVLTETGSGPLVVEQLSIIGANAGDFTIGAQTCTGNTIHVTGTCEVSIKFAPTVIGDRKAQLLVQIRGGRRTIVDLTGTGKEQPVPPKGPDFSATPETLAFGTRLLLSTSPESAVTISNKGESPLQITAIDIVGVPAPDYKVTKNTCVAAVPGGGQCTVAVTFQPKASGNRNAVLRFAHNAPGGVNLISLTGAANQPTIQVNPGVTPPGRVVTVIGKDFPPNLVVTVKFDGRIGQTTVKSANDGTFKAPLLIFPKATPETRTVLATMTEFATPLANTPLLIVFPTVSPANFVVRG